ncbi:hypothetical protein FrCorBMG51_11095 [Protofrankia coriariae]|uniref:Uncharacterized protein n=1 Tax=Protofrankia coriariae TaxID=1562887 RepID=A0ABR5F4B5_9ACTN|nr:hypothetical protein FrCorBMG51_11095 [Protofrankia coriariae]
MLGAVMVLAGERARASDVRHEIAVGTATTNSSTFTTTETVLLSVSADLIGGRTYAIEAWLELLPSVSADKCDLRIRENNVTGAVVRSARVSLDTAASSEHVSFYGRYTAAETGAKTLVLTGQRGAGSGNIQRISGPTFPGYLIVNQVS